MISVEPPHLSDHDLRLLAEGAHYRSFWKLGAHLSELNGKLGARFAVWAPGAKRVSVFGDFNGWNRGSDRMKLRAEAGVWELFVPDVGQGDLYKFRVLSRFDGHRADKSDPCAFASETSPQAASKVWDLTGYQWGDEDWMSIRRLHNSPRSAISIYEVQLGSWMRVPEEDNRSLSYREIAPKLADYFETMGFTHVELLPVSEHPLDAPWGYPTTSYFAPTSRFGTPQDFMYLIDTLHRRGIGVILDWAPAHFPDDEQGLRFFDGTHLYEHPDPRPGTATEPEERVFNYGRREVSNFLISNALFWCDKYHVDGLRVDAVAAILYFDRGLGGDGETPSRRGGRKNIEGIDFLRRFNEVLRAEYPDVMTIAEESSAWPMVSRPTSSGGLGFGFKWNMGWMNDILAYMSEDPTGRQQHHDKVTFSMLYALSENFVLPLPHHGVVDGKGSLIAKMPGDDGQKLANLRLLYGYMYGHSGKKLLFMGGEFGQRSEWSCEDCLDWATLDDKAHEGLQRWVRDLNTFYRGQPALFERDFEQDGFEWIDCHDRQSGVLSLLRRGKDAKDPIVFVCNFTPASRYYYRVGVPFGGYWQEVLNSDSSAYGGSNQGNAGGIAAADEPVHGRPCSLSITLPPWAVVVFRRVP